MVGRRVVVGGGIAVVAAGAGLHLAGRDDDALRALGARPRPLPDAADTAILRRAVAEQQELVAAVSAVDASSADDLVRVLRVQLEALGGADGAGGPTGTGRDAATVVASLTAAAARRQRDALAAVSPDLARVLASVAAGQAQVAQALGRRGGGAGDG